MTTPAERYVCVHGHFYQPPRENPWLGVIERQPGADPYHDWNERIAAECYAPNTRARVQDHERRILRLANNFLHVSFDLGPTLRQWLARHHPRVHARIVGADRHNARRHGGHGNAMAQGYGHLILPLSNERDRRTQVLWGLADFAHAFGRRAEGMWLPECAVDVATVRTLIDHGVRFVVLAPGQAGRVRPLSGGAWQDVDAQTLDTRGAYRLFDRAGSGETLPNRWLDVFFYRGELAHAISFEHLLRSAAAMLERFTAAFDQSQSGPQLASVATDGEDYGHHYPFGEMCLAYFHELLMKEDEPALTYYAQYRADHPPAWEVELAPGPRGEGTSWSCAHGVDRWARDCGCGRNEAKGWTTAWRAPLRAAFDALRARIDAAFEEAGARWLRDPWEARDAYVAVLLDPSAEVHDRFLAAHAPAARGDRAAEDAVWRLLEAEHNAMLMYTSCGWFFEDLARPEPVQNMRYALRAAQLAQPFAHTDLEALLVDALSHAKSNRADQGTGADLFAREVRPSVCPPETVAACVVLHALCDLEAPPYAYTVRLQATDRAALDGADALRGRLTLDDHRLHTTTAGAFLAALLPDKGPACWVHLCAEEQEAHDKLAAWTAQPQAELIAQLADTGVHLRDLPAESRNRLFGHVLGDKVAECTERFARTYDELRPYLGALHEHRVAVPAAARALSESVLSTRFTEACARLRAAGGWDRSAADEARAVLAEADQYGLEVKRGPGAQEVGALVLALLERLAQGPEPAHLEEIDTLVRFSREVGLSFENNGEIENRYWYLLRSRVAPWAAALRRGAAAPGLEDRASAEDLIERITRLGRDLNFAPGHLDELLAYKAHAEPDEGEL